MPPLRPNTAFARALRQTGRAATREDNDALIERVRAKEPAAIQRMIEANAALVVQKCRAYLRSRPTLAHLADDMLGAGLLALTEAVHRLADSESGSNVTGYLSVCIDGAFRSFSDSPVSCPASTRHRNAKAGEQLPEAADIGDYQVFADPRGMRELRDELRACCRPGTDDARIIDLRINGHDDPEIAAIIGKPASSVYYARRAIEKRFNARREHE